MKNILDSQRFLPLFNYKPFVNFKKSDEIPAPFSMLSALQDYNVCVETSIEKKGKTQKEILKPDESLSLMCSIEVQ